MPQQLSTAEWEQLLSWKIQLNIRVLKTSLAKLTLDGWTDDLEGLF